VGEKKKPGMPDETKKSPIGSIRGARGTFVYEGKAKKGGKKKKTVHLEGEMWGLPKKNGI